MSDLETTIYVAIRTAPAHVRRKLVSKNPIEGDAAADKLMRRIVEALEGYSIERIDKAPTWPRTF